MKPTYTEFYEHCKMWYCMGCEEKGDFEEGCEECPVGEVALDPPEKEYC
ncbi:unnamed protein product, partial [marine sediment metagenome]